MKNLIRYLIFAGALLFNVAARAQTEANDQSLRYQEQRMVFLQWDQNKFTPKPGFLSLNPEYWLTWGFFYPNYHKTDLRPLSATGPQTQRLTLVADMKSTDGKYKLQSDTARNTMLSEIANTTGAISEADPLWLLYYKKQFKPVLNYSYATLLTGQPPTVTQELSTEGILTWYNNEMGRLQQRVQGAHTADMDRGSRIMAYFRLLQEYKKINAVWNIRVAAAAKTIQMNNITKQFKSFQTTVPDWSPSSDVIIANKVLTHVQ